MLAGPIPVALRADAVEVISLTGASIRRPRAATAPGRMLPRMEGDRLTFLGHSTVLIEMDGTRLLTDPVLGHVLWSIRRRAPAVDAHHLTDVDVVFISHGHFDHLDLKSLRALPGKPTVLVPGGLGHIAGRAGLGPVQEVVAGDRVRIGTLELEVLPAAHGRRRSPLVQADASLGCLVVGSSTIYFAGDTDVLPAWEGLAGRVDVALLPVGGWGPRLGRGHLDPESAARAAATILPAVAVPIHWGTLSPIGLHGMMGGRFHLPGPEFAQAVARAAPGVTVHVLAPGASMAMPERTTRIA
jgi:L-ascorbate metabolism protein UlaG (beta-lactamase superfamily)